MFGGITEVLLKTMKALSMYVNEFSKETEQQREAFLQEQRKLKSALSKSAESKTRNQDQRARN